MNNFIQIHNFKKNNVLDTPRDFLVYLKIDNSSLPVIYCYNYSHYKCCLVNKEVKTEEEFQRLVNKTVLKYIKALTLRPSRSSLRLRESS